MMTEAETLRSLDNVFTRLALTSEANLEQVLWKLIPAVLRQLKLPGTPIQNKVLLILSHVNKRLEIQKDIKLPLLDLLTLLHEADAEGHPLIRNLAVVYIEKAIDRTTNEARFEAFPLVVKGIGSRSMELKMPLLRVAMIALEDVSQSISNPKKQKTEKIQNTAFLENPLDRKAFLEFACWTLLFLPKESIPELTSLIQNGQPLQLDNQTLDILDSVPPGLSLEQAQAVQGKAVLTESRLVHRKLGILSFLESVDLKDIAFLPFLIASTDPTDAVRREAEVLLRKNYKIDSDSKDIDLNDPELISSIFELFRVGLPQNGPLTAANAAQCRLPASTALRSKFFGILTKSTKATTCYLDVCFEVNPKLQKTSSNSIQVIQNCVFEGNAPTLRQQGMEFLIWVVKNGDADALKFLADTMMTALMELVQTETTVALKGIAYEAISQLAQRVPSAFGKDIEIAQDLFYALEIEPDESFVYVQSSLAALASLFQSADSGTMKSLNTLLLTNVHSFNSAVRLMSITWTLRLFPFEDSTARYICIVGSGDDRQEIQREARLGLDLSTFKRISTFPTSKYPPLTHFLTFLAKHSIMIEDDSKRSVRIHETLLDFLRHCVASRSENKISFDLLSVLLKIYDKGWAEWAPDALAMTAFEAIVDLLSNHQKEIAEWYAEKVPLLKKWIDRTNSTIRRCCSQLVGIVVPALTPQQATTFIQELSEILTPETKAKFEAKSGAILSFGYLTAQCSDRSILTLLVEKTKQQIVPLFDSNAHLGATVAMCLGLQLQNPLFIETLSIDEDFETWFSNSVWNRMEKLSKHNDVGVVTKIIQAIGWICKGLQCPTIETLCLKHLIELQNVKDDEIQRTISEAFAFAFAKQSIPSDVFLVSNFNSLKTTERTVDPIDALEVHGDIHGVICESLLEGFAHNRFHHRSACLNHVISLLIYCPRHPEILSRLERFQIAFLGLLKDKSGSIQERASRGVSLIYQLADPDVKTKLLTKLTSLLKDSSSSRGANQEIDREGDAEEAEGSKLLGGEHLTLYRILNSLAIDMEQPDLLYRFMDFTHPQSLKEIPKLTIQDRKDVLHKVVPKMYRLQFDPLPAVQSTMQSLWQNLVQDPKNIIETCLPFILQELITGLSSRFWRNRESSCQALTELLPLQKWTSIQPVFAELWRLALRVADDIKESVLLAGRKLLKILKRITLKYSDPNTTSASTIFKTVEIVLPVLLNVIQHPPNPGLGALALSTLTEIAKLSPVDALRPHLTSLVASLLENLNVVEYSSLDQLQLQMQGKGIETESFDALRDRLFSQSPIQEILDRCTNAVNLEVLEKGELISKLKEGIQRGVGTNNKLGIARFVAKMVNRLGAECGPFVSKLMNPLLQRCLSGESNAAVLKAYASTLGILCKVGSIASTERVVKGCLAAIETEGGNLKAVGRILKEVQSQAPISFSNHASKILPIAFLYRSMEEDAVAQVWGSLLEDVTESGILRLYGKEIVETIREAMARPQWSMKILAGQAIQRMFEMDAQSVTDFAESLLELLLEQLPGKLWDGKETLFKGIVRIVLKTPQVARTHLMTVVEALETACSKEKSIYRKAALEALADLLTFEEQKNLLYEMTADFLLTLAGTSLETEAEAKLPLVTVLKALSNASRGTDYTKLETPLDKETLALYHRILSTPRSWNVKFDVLETLIVCLEKTTLTVPVGDLETLLSSVLICLEETKYEQLRLKALSAVESVLANVGSEDWTSIWNGLEMSLKQHVANERSLAVKQRIETLLKTKDR